MTAQLAFLFLSYLLASIPFGLVITTLYGSDADIRATGSGNIGATNVARVYGWRLAGWVIFFDVAKGFVPVLLAKALWPDAGLWWPGLVALWCFTAHCFPAYLEFRGGKGVATGAGGLLALSPWVTVPAVGVWVTVVAATGRSSLAALTSVVAVCLLAWFVHPEVLAVVALFGVGVFLTHATNIRRLVRGEEKEVIRPVRWTRGDEGGLTAEQALAQGPGGGAVPPVWREGVADPLEE